MKVSSIFINEIRVTSFDPKNKEMTLEIEIKDKPEMKCKIILTHDFEGLTKKLINYIKESHKPEPDFDDESVLSGLSIVQIANDEEILFEWLSKSLARIEGQLFSLRRTKEAGSYMRQLDNFRTIKETLYKAKGI